MQTRLEAIETEIGNLAEGRTTEHTRRLYEEYEKIVDLMDKLEPQYEVYSGVLE